MVRYDNARNPRRRIPIGRDVMGGEFPPRLQNSATLVPLLHRAPAFAREQGVVLPSR
jgi:hypothetical protein